MDLDILETPLENLIALSDPEAAIKLDFRMLAWDRVEALADMSYADRGIIALEVERRKLWKYLGHTSFTAWAESRGRRATFYAKADVKELARDVPSEALQGIERENIKTLIQLSTADRRDPEIIEAARHLTNEQFVSKLEKERPYQHIQRQEWLRIPLVDSAMSVVNEAITKAMSLGCKTRAEAIEYISAEFLTGDTIEEECMRAPQGRVM